MLPESEPERQAALLLESGVRCLALRLGAAGSLVAMPEAQCHIPAIPVPVIDETGAGNAYCGGFLAGYVESGGDLLTAGRYGAVSATFALAQVGVAHLQPDARLVAEARLQQIIV
jgi:sugar/nucleoside kinase (ribokinase family)